MRLKSTGDAVASNSGNDTVNNFGIVSGNVKLSSGDNDFNNMAGGLVKSAWMAARC